MTNGLLMLVCLVCLYDHHCVLDVAENSLFGSPNDSDSLENGDSLKPQPPPMPKQSTGGGGLFDEDDDDDDDFFSGKTLKKPSPSKFCFSVTQVA